MTTRLTCLVLGFGVVGLSALAYAQETGTGVLKLPQDIEFKGPLTGPPQTVVLYGDPTKPGVFVSRVKFSAGWKDPPHWHPDEVRTVVVLSGTLYFGSGDKWDESSKASSSHVSAFLPGTSDVALSTPVDHGMRITLPMVLVSTHDFGNWAQYLPRNPGFM